MWNPPLKFCWEKKGHFCLLANHRVGNGCAVGMRSGEDNPHREMLHWRVGFKDCSFSPCTPALGEIGHAAFLWLIPTVTTPWNCLGFLFKANSDAAQGCYVQLKVKEKTGEKRKEKKNQSFTENMKGSGKKRLTGWFLHKYNPSKESICCLLTCENFLIKANHIRTVSEYFFVNLFHIHSLHGIATAQHPLLKAAQTHTFPWRSPTHQAHLR